MAQAPAASQAALEESSDALLRLGDLYSEGDTVAPDYAKAIDYYRQAAATGRVKGALRVGEMMLRGEGVSQDIAGGLAAIETVANDGYPAALVLLGDLYSAQDQSPVARDLPRALDYYRRAAEHDDGAAQIAYAQALSQGFSGPVDSAAVVAAYEKAGAMGRVDAWLALGEFLSQGRVVAVDLPRALDYYRRSAAAGSDTGKLRLAEMLVRGAGAPQDAAAGLELVHAVIAGGNASGLVLVGDLLSGAAAIPVDSAAAIKAYEQAAAAGRTDAMLRLGDLYRDGDLVRADAGRAALYYQQAADAGDRYALYVLGRGLTEQRFGAAGTVAQGMTLLEQAQGLGVADALIGLANVYLYGYGTPRDMERGIALLTQGLAAGNLAAGEQLVAIYRDGRMDSGRVLIRPQEALARDYFAQVSDRWDRGTRLVQSRLLDAAFAPASGYDRLLADIGELSPGDRVGFLRSLLRVNPNAYVHAMQLTLNALGLRSGQPTGLLDRTTIRAVGRYCELNDAQAICRRGPLTEQTARLLAYAALLQPHTTLTP